MKIFKKKDEMELEIQHKSNMFSLVFLEITLIILMLVEAIRDKEWTIYLYLICCSSIVNFIARQFYRKKLGDEGWKSDVIFFIILFVCLVLVSFVIPFILIEK